MPRLVFSAVIVSILLLLSTSAFAHSSGELLNFQGLGDMQTVGNFYDGGGLASTPNYGITFSSNFFGLRSMFNGGSGEFVPDPTGTPAIFMSGSTPTVSGYMNVNAGFSTGIQFFYSAFTQQTITVWSGANGTGTVLATITLSANACATNPYYCTWTSVGLTFSGVAKSVTFSGSPDNLGIADITLGASSTAIPEPSTFYLLGIGLAGMSLGWLGKLLVV